MDKSKILENISNLLLENRIEEAKATIQNEYPHKHIELEKRSYTIEEICQILHIGRSRAMELCTCGAFRVVRIRRSLRKMRT